MPISSSLALYDKFLRNAWNEETDLFLGILLQVLLSGSEGRSWNELLLLSSGFIANWSTSI